MNLSRPGIFLLCILSLAACSDKKEVAKTVKISVKKEVKKNLDYSEVRGTLLIVEDKQNDSVSLELEGNLFGRFYNDRAEFFVIKNPTNRIHNSDVKSISLSFLDGKLSQAKYVLESNPVDQLIRAYGNFAITGLDFKNQDIIENGRVLVRSQSGVTMNGNLDHYEIKWTVGGKQIRYKVDERDNQAPYKYLERAITYEDDFRRIIREGS